MDPERLETPTSLRSPRARPPGASQARRPRVWRIALSRRGAELHRSAWHGSAPALDRLGCWSGGALALALAWEQERRSATAPAPLVVAVGQAVRRGLSTAARASISSRSPLSGLFAEGQVGGELGRRLARLCDALAIEGRAELPGAVLHLRASEEPELVAFPELDGAPPRAILVRVQEVLGPCAVLCTGPAGARGIPFASLVSGGEVPHYVGRGGLGAVLGRLGLTAVALSAEPVEAEQDARLVSALLRSPRLEARAHGGTLELASALAARGELVARGELLAAGHAEAARFDAQASAARGARHGCRGCPTPCGWTFSVAEGGPQLGARFGAAQALGLELGLDFDGALALLAACDAAALDAKETGACLGLLCAARARGALPEGPDWGEREALLGWVESLSRGEPRAAPLERGAAALAEALGLDPPSAVARGQRGLAALLARCIGTRGGDPMRTFPFLASDGGARERLERLVAPLELPPGAEDPALPAGKGRLVWWHENLAAALDVSGFCAFSAAGLLSDGVCSLDELARWIAPAALLADGSACARGAGWALIEAGDALALLRRDLDARWGAASGRDRPAWAREALELPGMWDEYSRLRGVGDDGRLSEEGRRRLEGGGGMDVGLLAAPAGGAEVVSGASDVPPVRGPGRVVLRCSGSLAKALGTERSLEVEGVVRLEELLRRACERSPGIEDVLFRDGELLPSAFREGQRLDVKAWISPGETVDLVLVISGG